METDTEKEHKRVKDSVENLLLTDSRTRNSDLWLVLQYWQRTQQIKLYVPYDKLKEMVTPETITRARRVIQNTEGRLLPTDEDVLKRRGIKEKELRRMFSKEKDRVVVVA